MNAQPHRAQEALQPLELTSAEAFGPDESYAYEASEVAPAGAEPGVGGRQVLGWSLSILALLWIGFVAWSAGSSLGSQSITAPVVAHWLAVAAGPLALLGLGWLLFGRTRRREAERFTHSVQVMQTEARGLEALLGILRQRIDEEQSALSAMAERMMRLGDETTHRLGGVTRELEGGAEALARHGLTLDRTAENARADLGVLLQDLPRAEASARAMAEELRGSGLEASSQAAALEAQLHGLTVRAREADESVGGAAKRLVAHLTQIESSGGAAAVRVGEVAGTATAEVNALLERTADALAEIRQGIDVQSAAVTALVEQSASGMNRAGVDTAQALGTHIQRAGGALDQLSVRLAEQERASQALVAGVERSLAELDQNFVDLAAEGDLRAATLASAIGRVRSELDSLSMQSASSDGSLESLTQRTQALRDSLTGLHSEVGERLSGALGDSEGAAERLLATVHAARPEIEWMREAAGEASQRLAGGADGLAQQQDRLAALLAGLDDGVGGAEQRLAALSAAIVQAESDAARLQAETAPALVQAMVQVREASAHAADRAREAIAAVIPASAERFSAETKVALEQVVRETVREQLSEVEAVAARAVEAARVASDRLTAQLLTIGQTATALETHIERKEHASQQADSEAFARRSAMLIDSMHSAAIDVGKILSDEVDDRAWANYLKGDRGVFTRRAVRLLGNSESRALSAHYEQDGEFQAATNRFVHDFEAMLRRVMGERDGGPMAVTLMSSDMGKLYAALTQVIEKRR
ncbi:MAG: hypothetical protein AVDCRST_MAG62-285 [uncultured Sphingomonas sp.]|uniref:ATPase n=1 Tax=uncultured Sphingomonas sp. TaxID=158754 RepID=A0A6J4SVU6_9SPHN|nr:MAG: hypothetical protein AVDCRST_MAG62-285 [uncultured Sphingomonas sp.]